MFVEAGYIAIGVSFALSIYISIDKIIQYDITINQSGDLIIPILGQFYASNITLDQLKTNLDRPHTGRPQAGGAGPIRHSL